jgi:mono/diheme cytochrome c family protein
MNLVIVAVFAATWALTGCEGLPGRPRPDARELGPTEVTAFAPLYARNCAGCHGQTGRLGAARPLNDPVYLAVVPAERMRQVIATGIPGTAQPAFALSAGGSLTDQQIDGLVQGIKDRWQRPEAVADYQVPTYAASPPARPGDVANVDRGRAVFAAACARCHGEGGRGGPKGGAVADPSYLALVSDQHLRTTVIAGRSDLGMPDWRLDGAAAPLTPQQISDVVAWLVAQRRPVPGRLP